MAGGNTLFTKLINKINKIISRREMHDKGDVYPVIVDIKDFDTSSGNLLERMIFNYRLLFLIGCAILTLVLGYSASKLVFNAGFDKMIPTHHPYIKNYMANRNDIRGLGNAVYIVVENTQGDIFDPEYLNLLMQINDEVFLLPGVDRAWMRSLWMAGVRWTGITEVGWVGGPVMPLTYDGSTESLEQLRLNISRSDIMDKLVARNYKSSMIFTPLLEYDFKTGKRLDYAHFSKQLEDIRQEFEAKSKGKIKIHITGFAMIVGNLIHGLRGMAPFFGFAVVICGVIVFLYTHCLRSMIVLIISALIAVLWQLGIISALGYELDPYQILVPFLVFAIGVSHGAQKMNGIMQDIGRGTHKLVAARYTYRRLFTAGLTAILADAVGFAVLLVIDIPVIRDLVITASIGVIILIFSKLIMLPIILSYIGVSPSAAKRSLVEEAEETRGKGIWVIWEFFDRFTRHRWAVGAIVVAAVLASVGLVVRHHVRIGDVHPGAPELWPNSAYNRDASFTNDNYGYSSDQFAVILKTQFEGIIQYPTLIEIDRLAWALQQVPGVRGVATLADTVSQVTSGACDESPKWLTISRNQGVTNYGASIAVANNPALVNNNLSVTPIIAYLTDHKAVTLERVAKAAEDFAKDHSDKDRQFLLAAGTSGIDAATNSVVEKNNRWILLYVYIVITVLCLITFGSWRATVVTIISLIVTSILCEAIMVVLGIGVKVATLPVIALGVGIGVDYHLYLVTVQVAHQRSGLSLSDAYKRALGFTGKVVCMVGLTMTAAVINWEWSPIKFQADMGILLAFMFLCNMIGALTLVPALSYFLPARHQHGA